VNALQVHGCLLIMLRNTQFREDARLTCSASPVYSLTQYQAIDNFYTTTIYGKVSWS